MSLRIRFIVIAACSAVLLLIILTAGLVRVTTVGRLNPDGSGMSYHLPYRNDNAGSEIATYQVDLPVSLVTGPFSWLPGAQSYRIIPDDQLYAIWIDDVPVSLEGISASALTDYRLGFVIDLSASIAEALRLGTARTGMLPEKTLALKLQVGNRGGPGGIDVRHGWSTFLDTAQMVLFWFLLLVCVLGRALSPVRANRPVLFLIAGSALVGIIARLALWGGLSGDYVAFLQPWYETIRDQGFSAFGTGFANYTPPYLYLLGFATLLPLPPLAAVKLISILGDLVLAAGAYRLAEGLATQRRGVSPAIAGRLPAMAFAFTLFIPTVLLNGSYWGQCDSLYTAALIWALAYAVQRRGAAAFVWWGVGLAFKLQAAFIGPVFLALLLGKELKWRFAPLVFVPYVVAILPSMVAGRPAIELLTVYLAQADTYGRLTMNAPSMYQWFANGTYEIFTQFGLAISAAAALFLVWKSYRAHMHRAWRNQDIMLLALAACCVLPFLLPKMHERYFFPADVLSVVWVLYRPRDWIIPAGIVGASFFSYLPFLFGAEPIPFAILSLAAAVGSGFAVRRWWLDSAAIIRRRISGPR